MVLVLRKVYCSVIVVVLFMFDLLLFVGLLMVMMIGS